ncbi:hypothetical protein SAMN02745691_01207 [Parasporobacterium paucivorans DSM 15970]|uniref:Uncharacterized protein n=2 Tax=Parasporobacterium TaxID=115543 RepID=A0A1M6FUR5_9FIRM|nr:hypothetical protein SAMN02745691_01207 [Parasporobacterium paucivorans DSM 15970]
MVAVFCLARGDTVWAYGEKIDGFQTHYEIHNQYISGGCLVLEGFYYVYELQNFTDSSRGTGTHHYYLELNNNGETKKYYDTGNYYMDLTELEFKTGYPWASVGEDAVVSPSRTDCNYRYRDIGFQFRIPMADLTDFKGLAASWNMKLTCVATNTYKGRGTEVPFKQESIYCSRTFSNLKFQDYSVMPYSGFSTLSSRVYASIGYVRSGPGRGTNIMKYNGKNIYWAEGEWFNDLSNNAAVSVGSEKVTWYGLRYGGVYLDGVRYRAKYDPGGTYGWLPSVFLDSISGTPYVITIENTPPVIMAKDIAVTEGTLIDASLLLNGVSAYDHSFGTIVPSIYSTNLALNSTQNDTGIYYVTYHAADTNMAETYKTVQITIKNEIPRIYAGNKNFGYGKVLTKDFLLENVTAFDLGDGDLTDQIVIADSGGLVLDSDANENGTYTITYAVTDSHNTTGYEKGFLYIFKRHVRSISLDSMSTLSADSKWNTRMLRADLATILERYGVEEAYEQSWYFENQDKDRIRAYVFEHGPSRETNRWILDNFSECRVK